MKQVIGVDVGSYVFAPGVPGAGTVTFSGLPTIRLEQIALVVNVTRGEILFNFADPTRKASLVGAVLTLVSADTASHSSGDRLMAVVDLPAAVSPAAPTTETNSAAVLALVEGMQAYLVAILDRMPRVDTAKRLVVTGAEATQPISGTVTTVTTLANVGAGRAAESITQHLSNPPANVYDRIAVS